MDNFETGFICGIVLAVLVLFVISNNVKIDGLTYKEKKILEEANKLDF